jgi:hypothetical protein
MAGKPKVAFTGTGGTIASIGDGPLLSLALTVTSDPSEIGRIFATY